MQGLFESRSASAAKAKQLTFELFFPRAPYFGAQYRAARGKVPPPPPPVSLLATLSHFTPQLLPALASNASAHVQPEATV